MGRWRSPHWSRHRGWRRRGRHPMEDALTATHWCTSPRAAGALRSRPSLMVFEVGGRRACWPLLLRCPCSVTVGVSWPSNVITSTHRRIRSSAAGTLALSVVGVPGQGQQALAGLTSHHTSVYVIGVHDQKASGYTGLSLVCTRSRESSRGTDLASVVDVQGQGQQSHGP